jgi:uncharacterized OB-fold protein
VQATREPRGTLFTWTTIAFATAKGFADLPYVVGVVELSCEPYLRLVGNVIGVAAEDLRIGMPVEGTFVPAGPNGEFTVLQWNPTAAE